MFTLKEIYTDLRNLSMKDEIDREKLVENICQLLLSLKEFGNDWLKFSLKNFTIHTFL